MVIQKRSKHSRSFSELTTIVRISLYDAGYYTFLDEPEKDWAKMIQESKEATHEPSLFD